MQPPPTVRREAAVAGVIETLSAGFSAINRQVWVLLVPLAIDFFLWRGPQVSFAPLIDPVVLRFAEALREAGELASTGAATGASAEDAEALRRMLMAFTTDKNVLALIARGPLGIPTVSGVLSGAGVFSFVGGWDAGLPILLASLAAGLFLGGAFRALIAQRVRDGASQPLHAFPRVPVMVWRVVLLVGLLFLGTILLGGPVLVVLGGAMLLSPAMGAFGTLALTVAIVFAEIYLFFALDAIFVSDVGPVAAIRASVGIARRYLGSTVSLIALTWLILAGMDRVWELMMGTLAEPFGVVLGMFGNAYIASGLIAASMIFYRDRAALVDQASPPARG